MKTESLTIKSHAKLNWYLRVFEPRQDGYHDLETVFQELDLADELTFTFRPDSDDCNITGFPADVAPETNLVRRAWQLLRDIHPNSVPGINVAAVKNIPRGGGLGGGSSNAAATLVALNDMAALGLTPAKLEQLAAKLGSDVPFFIRGGCAIGRGRGEQLTPIENAAAFHLVLLFPEQVVSTREAYARLDSLSARPVEALGIEAVRQSLTTGDAAKLAISINNDFEHALKQDIWYNECISALDEVGCLRAFLCGSGSTVAGLAKDNRHSVEMFEQLRYILPHTRSTACTLAGRGAASPVGCRDLRRTS